MNLTTATNTKTASNGEQITYTYWRGQYQDANGVRRSVNLGNVEAVAKSEARRRLAEAVRLERRRPLATATVGGWTRTFIDRLNLSEQTINQYERARGHMIEAWGESRPIKTLTATDAATFIAQIRKGEVSDYTVRNLCVSAKAMLAQATKEPSRERPYLAHNPFEDADIPHPTDASTFTYISPAQTTAILAETATANMRALVALTRLCALRLEEAFSVEPGHVNWSKHFIEVELREDRAGRGAGTKQSHRKVPLSPAAYGLILARFEQMPEGDRFIVDRSEFTKGTRMKPQDHMRALMKAAGVTAHKPFHDLRKSQAQDWSVLHGCEHSAKWCGHSIEVALRHYRDNEEASLALVTGLGDPKATLRSEYDALESALNMR